MLDFEIIAEYNRNSCPGDIPSIYYDTDFHPTLFTLSDYNIDKNNLKVGNTPFSNSKFGIDVGVTYYYDPNALIFTHNRGLSLNEMPEPMYKIEPNGTVTYN